MLRRLIGIGFLMLAASALANATAAEKDDSTFEWLRERLAWLGETTDARRTQGGSELYGESENITLGLAAIVRGKQGESRAGRVAAANLLRARRAPEMVRPLVEEIDFSRMILEEEPLSIYTCAYVLPSFGAQAVTEILLQVDAAPAGEVSDSKLSLYAEVITRCFREIGGNKSNWPEFALARIDGAIAKTASNARNLKRLRAAVRSRVRSPSYLGTKWEFD